ncbi:MAG: hypothetical protein ACKO3I_11570, partial [Synechococcales cyanobacterium]
GALIVSWLVFTWLIRVFKTTAMTALSIAAIILILQVVFGIGPQQLWNEVSRLPQTLLELLSGK